MFGPKKEEVTGGWKNYTMRSFRTCKFSSSIRAIKSRKFKWAVNVEGIAENGNVHKDFLGKA
jgi:hypothetical protein